MSKEYRPCKILKEYIVRGNPVCDIETTYADRVTPRFLTVHKDSIDKENNQCFLIIDDGCVYDVDGELVEI